jgi:hypothetical protein
MSETLPLPSINNPGGVIISDATFTGGSIVDATIVGVGTASPDALVHINSNITTTALTGTLTATEGLAAVSGVGTLFSTELSVNDHIKIGTSAQNFQVFTVTDDTNLVLSQAHNDSQISQAASIVGVTDMIMQNTRTDLGELETSSSIFFQAGNQSPIARISAFTEGTGENKGGLSFLGFDTVYNPGITLFRDGDVNFDGQRIYIPTGSLGIGASPVYPLDINSTTVSARINVDNPADTVSNNLYLETSRSGGVGGVGLGSSMKFSAESSTTLSISQGVIGCVWTNATHATRTSDMTFETIGTAVASEKMRIKGDGGIIMSNLKSGATQGAAGAGVGELWITDTHATLPDNVVLIGV